MVTVGVVDDEHLVRGGVRMLLSAEPDITVIGEAEDGEGALALVAEHDPDVLLMDIRMPRLDGVGGDAGGEHGLDAVEPGVTTDRLGLGQAELDAVVLGGVVARREHGAGKAQMT